MRLLSGSAGLGIPLRRALGVLVSALVVAVAIAACGGSLDRTISMSKLKDMSRQGQLWVYDAENGIVVALDRLDEARDERHRIRAVMVRAKRRLEAAEKRGSRSGVDMAEAWITYLEQLEKWARANIRLRKFGVLVAQASVELAKAQVIQREDLLGGKDFNVKEFHNQYQDLQDLFDKRAKKVRGLRKKARENNARWWSLRRRYVAKTGDYDHGLWID